MLRRIVRLEFDPEKVAEFAQFFSENRETIAAFPGCVSLDLFKDATHNNVYYTFSLWENEDALEAYRHSDTFRHLWSFAKARFAGKPQAFSLLEV